MTATLFAGPVFAANADAEGVKLPSVPEQETCPTREKFLQRFDQDGDGKLNELERQAAREEMRRQRAEKDGPMRNQLIKRFDQDGDRQLSDAEKAEARKAGEARRAKAKEHHQEILTRFDADGDGKLSDTEHQAMRDAWQKFLEQPPPVKPAGG